MAYFKVVPRNFPVQAEVKVLNRVTWLRLQPLPLT